jgi:hypothetical protein
MNDSQWKVVSYNNTGNNNNSSNISNMSSNMNTNNPQGLNQKIYWKNYCVNKQPITTTEQVNSDTSREAWRPQQSEQNSNTIPVNLKTNDGMPSYDNKYLITNNLGNIDPNNYRRPCYKPCDKFNLEGYCRWGDRCKYSHKDLTQQEWEIFYPSIPFSIKLSNYDKRIYDSKYRELESKVKVLEYKMKCMDTHYENKIGQLELELNLIKKAKIPISSTENN